MKKLNKLFKIRSLFKLIDIDVFIYVFETVVYDHKRFEYNITSDNSNYKTEYKVYDGNTLIHKSICYNTVFLLRLIKQKGPVIGDCFTLPRYRGQGIYPYMLSLIAKQKVDAGVGSVYVIVNTNNLPSIRGIEKAGYVKLAHIKARRIGFMYLNKSIELQK